MTCGYPGQPRVINKHEDESMHRLGATPMWIRVNIPNPYKSAYRLTTNDKTQTNISKQSPQGCLSKTQ